jgi:response regulator NasT
MELRLRIAVADDEPDMQEYFEKILPRLGHEVVSIAETGRQLVEHCEALNPDLVITDIKMPDMDGIEAATAIYQRQAIPVILVSAFHDRELIERAESDHIMAYLVKPIKQADLEPAIALARRRFEQFEALRRETVDIRQALEDRKIVERAKGILMQRTGLDEQSAFTRLQRLASDKNLRMAEIARTILLADEAFVTVRPSDVKVR